MIDPLGIKRGRPRIEVNEWQIEYYAQVVNHDVWRWEKMGRTYPLHYALEMVKNHWKRRFPDGTWRLRNILTDDIILADIL